MPLSIAIDGPSASGKSTLAKALAEKYGFIYIDTGALYRTVGLYVHELCLSSQDAEAIVAALPEIHIEMQLRNGRGEVYLNGRPVGDEIRTPVCSLYASDVSKLPEVRAFLLSLQRDIAAKHNVVMDGRDIGTVILPDADVKLFMSASDEERARRRWRELNDKGIRTTLSEVMTEMRSRDENDKNRAIAPAVPAPDALPLDNTGMTAAETVAAADRLIRDRLGDKLLQAEACL